MRAAHLDEWQVFSNRYGLRQWDDQTWSDKQPWCARHRSIRADVHVKHWCRCPGGGSGVTPCALPVTQEDGMCDECREWCVAVDDAGTYYFLADLAERRQRPARLVAPTGRCLD